MASVPKGDTSPPINWLAPFSAAGRLLDAGYEFIAGGFQQAALLEALAHCSNQQMVTAIGCGHDSGQAPPPLPSKPAVHLLIDEAALRGILANGPGPSEASDRS